MSWRSIRVSATDWRSGLGPALCHIMSWLKSFSQTNWKLLLTRLTRLALAINVAKSIIPNNCSKPPQRLSPWLHSSQYLLLPRLPNLLYKKKWSKKRWHHKLHRIKVSWLSLWRTRLLSWSLIFKTVRICTWSTRKGFRSLQTRLRSLRNRSMSQLSSKI